MSRKWLASFAFLFALAIVPLLSAQQGAPPAGQSPPPGGQGPMGREMGGPPVLGAITSVGVDRFELKRADGTTQTIMVSAQTHIRPRGGPMEQSQELKLEDLKVGDHVAVRGTLNADKQVVAMSVSRLTDEQYQRFSSGGFPGGPMGGPMAGTRAFGEIVSIDQNQIKVRNWRGETTIAVSDKTTFTKEGQSIKLSDLKVGDRVMAAGKTANDQFLADEIRVGGPGRGRGGWPGPPPGQGPPQQ